VKIKLHRPNRNLWIVAVILFIAGVVGSFISIPLLSAVTFYLVALSAALLLLGTWVF
jgi:hypothetical protein